MNLPQFLLPKEPQRVWDLAVPIVKNGFDTHVYLTDEIHEPFQYDELNFLLRTAAKGENFYLYLNTPGGHLDSAIAVSGSLRATKATTTAIISGSVNSAGTMITMACDRLEVDPHTSFMIHYYSAGVSGKGNELKQRQEFMDRSLANLMHDVYKGFLTEDEINATIDGTDYWFDHIEIQERWKNKSKRNR